MSGITSLLQELPSGYSRLTHFVLTCSVIFLSLVSCYIVSWTVIKFDRGKQTS